MRFVLRKFESPEYEDKKGTILTITELLIFIMNKIAEDNIVYRLEMVHDLD